MPCSLLHCLHVRYLSKISGVISREAKISHLLTPNNHTSFYHYPYGAFIYINAAVNKSSGNGSSEKIDPSTLL